MCLLRGSHKTPGEIAPRRFLEAIAGPHQPPIEHGSGRLELAERMVDPSDPFVPRVMVNRVWQHLFGRGIVPTVDNFGVLGQRPTHPELLDFLADRFVREGWSVKRLIREIVLSRRIKCRAKRASAIGKAIRKMCCGIMRSFAAWKAKRFGMRFSRFPAGSICG